jgi:uncharacterized protein YecT (DUF1311 family)
VCGRSEGKGEHCDLEEFVSALKMGIVIVVLAKGNNSVLETDCRIKESETVLACVNCLRKRKAYSDEEVNQTFRTQKHRVGTSHQ